MDVSVNTLSRPALAVPCTPVPNRLYVAYLRSSLSRRLGAGLALAALTGAGASALLSGQAQAAKSQQILLVSYAVTKAAYDQIIPHCRRRSGSRRSGPDSGA